MSDGSSTLVMKLVLTHCHDASVLKLTETSATSAVPSSVSTRFPNNASKGSFSYETKLKRPRIQELQFRIRRSPEIRTPVVARGTMREETLSVTQTRETNCDIPMSPQRRELPTIFPCWSCSKQNNSGTTCCRCGANEKNRTEDQEGKAQATHEVGFANIRSLTQLEIIPERLRGNPMSTAMINNCTEKADNTGRKSYKKSSKVMQHE